MNAKFTYSSPNNTTQGIPSSAIKPVQEIIEAILNHVMGSSVVEPSEIKSYLKDNYML